MPDGARERTEYRVFGENFRDEVFATKARNIAEAIAFLRGWKSGGALSARIQKRTVTETPWVDCEEGEDG